jgi:DNA-directed RNA polymerase specialized sigma54-like protein
VALAPGGEIMSAAPSTKRRPGPVQKVDHSETMAEHLLTQQHRIYQAANSVQIAMKAIDSMDEEGTNRDLVALWGALSLIKEILTDIAGEIELPAVLNQEVAHG